jgi:hypothetical protein
MQLLVFAYTFKAAVTDYQSHDKAAFEAFLQDHRIRWRGGQ